MVTIEVRNMSYRSLLVSAVLASGLVGFAAADMVAVPNGIAVKDSDVNTPTRGMTMSQVASKFGEPVTKVPAVGKPPISRWEYPGFIVYFEHEHVIHSVVNSGAAAPTAPAESAPASPAPADSTPADATPSPPADSTAAPSPPSAEAAPAASSDATPASSN
jgi:hypothetical protein